MNKYVINVIMADGSRLSWSNEKEIDHIKTLNNIMQEDGYIESLEDYGTLFINRKNIVAIEVHDKNK